MSANMSLEVPFIDLAWENRALLPEIREAFERVFASNAFVLGPEVEALEAELAKRLNAPSVLGCSSGTDAELIALMALGIGPGDEVITTPFTFVSTATCIVRVGASPVFVDIEPNGFHIDASKITQVIGPRTRAIIAVHLYGQPADIDALLEISQRFQIHLLEDAAQSILANTHRGMTGTIGTAGWISFYPTKNLGAFGDAGLVITRDPDLAKTMKMIRNHGAIERYEHLHVGGNFRMDALQAAVLRVKLRKLEEWTAKRRKLASLYDTFFAELGIDPERFRPPPRLRETHVYHQYVVRSTERDALRLFLAERGIATDIHYPKPLHLQPCFARLGHKPLDFPEAERASREVLALPIHPSLSEAQIERVVSAIADFYRG
ncbi:MAG: DegT/DnrJ/EryC1/StrS family aminotransferase [Sandaracinaceae bacterium]|nr:DegT/DnrJ/EryC1/StrS family aminotransferase [Sandaracinaceae bacterium]MDW8245603.1 DegT/DnrJ/EryC1/StrS family aminotransferase [Sandaracinaceae bacterium]